MKMSTTKINNQIFELNTIKDFENVIKLIFFNFNKLNVEYYDLVNRDILNANVHLSKKRLIPWVRKNIFKSCVSNKSIDFWTNRGYSVNESKLLISNLQKELSNKRTNKIKQMKIDGNDSWKKMFNVHIDYWLERGYSNEEAKAKLKNRQSTFSLKKCIQKHGTNEGLKMFNDRQEKWLNTLSNKTDEEKTRIKEKKVVPLGQASRESLRIFDPIANHIIDKKYLKSEDIFYGYLSRKEWFLSSSDEFYLYDFCIPKLKLIIEYQGKVFHPNTEMSNEAAASWKSAYGVPGHVVKLKDEKKKLFAEKNGFRVEYLYGEDGFEKNFEKAKNLIFDSLETIEVDRDISEIEHLLKTSRVLIDTPTGYQPVINFVDKPNKQLLKVILEDELELVCSDDHLLYSDNKWILAKEIFENKNTLYKLSTRFGEKSVVAITDEGIGDCVDITVECLDNHYYSADITSHNCGKTLLALAAALEQTKGIGGAKATYNKLVVTRPIQPVGKELGFLPGTLEEKMEPWIAPIRDNFNFLIGSKKNFRVRKQNQNSSYDQKRSGRDDGSYLSLLQEKGLIEIEAITFIRGRSIPDSFIIIDEAQNLSVHELKTIITRVGDGTKIVLTGDLEQIDNVHVDAFSNGLSYAIEKFKDYSIAAHVTLLKGERSELATLASQIL